jgi:hypothetical protein
MVVRAHRMPQRLLQNLIDDEDHHRQAMGGG